jgi:hypothetical protein
MKIRQLMFAAIGLAMMASHAKAQNFTDTSMGVRWGAFYSNPGGEEGSRNVNKTIANLAMFNVWNYGSNFANVDVLFSNANEPANNSGGGSTELYAVYRGQLSPDKIFGLNTAFGPIQAINFEFGGDAETENTQFAPNKKLLIVGPNFHIGIPAGFLNIGVHFSKEWNNNGICRDACSVINATTGNPEGGPISFAAAPEFEVVWLYPLAFTGLPMDFRGFLNAVGPKGIDGFGNHTYWEILARPQLNLDIGKMLFNKPHTPDIYLAVEMWQHKFGNSSSVSGSSQIAPTIGMEVHF